MKLNDIYPLISSHQITLYDRVANKAHGMNPESVGAIMQTIETLEAYGNYEVVKIIPLDFQHLQITIKKEG